MNFLGSISPIFYKLQLIGSRVKVYLTRQIVWRSIQGMLGRNSGKAEVADIAEVLVLGDPSTTARTVAKSNPSTVDRATRIARRIIRACASRSGLGGVDEITNYGLSIHEGIIT